MHTFPANRSSRHRLSLATGIALAVAVLSTLLTLTVAAPAHAQEPPADPPAMVEPWK